MNKTLKLKSVQNIHRIQGHKYQKVPLYKKKQLENNKNNSKYYQVLK